MKKTLVPCDFSSTAVNAFRFALDVAAQSKGTVHLLHVIELPVLHDSILMPVLSFEQQMLDELREKAEKGFNKILSKYNKTDAVDIAMKVEFGVPSKVIQNYVKDHAVDGIIMGSHGASGVKEFFIGSTAEKIVRNASVPVLVLKDYYKGPVKNIVFPHTLDIEDEEDLIAKVKALQNFFKAKLHIVWINTPLNFTTDSISLERLTNFARRYNLKDYTINIYNHLELEEGILEFSNSVKANMIAMGTHGRTGLDRLISGSLTESVVNHSKKLVWSYVMKEELVEA